MVIFWEKKNKEDGKKSRFLLEIPNEGGVIMPFKYTDEKENFLYAWRAFSYGKKIEIFC